MLRIEKQYIVFKYIECVRIYDTINTNPNHYTFGDEYQWKREAGMVKTLPDSIEQNNTWHEQPLYILLTDMFDSPHEVKSYMVRRFYEELYEYMEFGFKDGMKTLKLVINTLEKQIGNKNTICAD